MTKSRKPTSRRTATVPAEIPALVDPEGFLAAIQSKARWLREGHSAGLDAAPRRLKAKGLLFAGMGFSGMVADVVMDAASRTLKAPAAVVKHYRLPSYATKGWHTLAVTYSGDTEETLEVVRASLGRKVPVTGFSTGGKLGGLVERIVAQPKGQQPRAAFGYTWFSVLGFLEGARLLGEAVPVEEAAKAVEAVDQSCGPNVPLMSNPAKQLAVRLAGPIPQIYATPAFLGVGLHFKGMLNENAKKIAKVDLVPESNHNDLTGWSGDESNRGRFAVVALHHGAQNPELKARLDYMRRRYREWGVDWNDREAGPVDSFPAHIIEQARAIQFLDYTSVYVAALRGQDPADIREIKALKGLLRSRAPEPLDRPRRSPL